MGLNFIVISLDPRNIFDCLVLLAEVELTAKPILNVGVLSEAKRTPVHQPHMAFILILLDAVVHC